jgi:hypothetical protein
MDRFPKEKSMLNRIWTEDDIKVVDAFSWARKSAHLFFREGKVTGEEICIAVFSDALQICSEVTVMRHENWWTICSKLDWLPSANVKSLFEQIVPINGVPNSVRSEFLVAAFSSAYFVMRSGLLILSSGVQAPIEVLDFARIQTNVVGFAFEHS